MKKVQIVALVATSLVFFSCFDKKDSQKETSVTLTMAEVNPEETLIGQMDKIFKEKVEEFSGGSVKIDVVYSGILGNEQQVLELVKTPDSSIQLMRGPSNLEKIGGKKSLIISVPFTFNNDEHFWKFAQSPVAEEILNEPYANGLGVKGLFYAEEGFRHLFSIEEKPIKSVEDLQGMKFRVAGSVLTNLGKAFKADNVTVPFNDLYSAFQTGKAEAAEQPLSNYLANSFHKVAKNLTLDGHMLGVVQVMINTKTWDSLSPKQQEAIVEAGKFAQDFCKKTLEDQTSKALIQAKAEGVNVIEVTDKSPWQEACKDMISESSKSYPELYQQILELGR